MDAYRLILGDSLEELRKLEENSVDSMVTDPPSSIAFMNKAWDRFDDRDHFIESMTAIFKECLRVMKPGAHGFVWAIPRTSHWTATSLEDAGFEIRDVVTHVFGSGFPKGLSIDKAIDKMNGDQRPVIGKHPAPRSNINATHSLGGSFQESPDITSAASAASAAWQGWGTALKPASEHWILVRKPLEKGLSIAANVLKWRTGALNIDASRIKTNEDLGRFNKEDNGMFGVGVGVGANAFAGVPIERQGRWPANLVLSHQNTEIFKLKHDILSQVKTLIEEYYVHYNQVPELQEKHRNHRISCQNGQEILQSKLQGSDAQESLQSEKRSEEMSAMQREVLDLQMQNGQRDLLLTQMQGQVPRKTDEGTKSSIRCEAHTKVPQTNIEESKSENDGSILSMEGRPDDATGRLHYGNDSNPAHRDAEICEKDNPGNVYLGTPGSDGSPFEARPKKDGSGPSHQWDQGGQSNREPIAGRPKESLDPSSASGTAILHSFKRESALEVFAQDIPKEWLKYFEYSRSHGCVEVGTKDVGSGSGSGYNFEESNNDNPTHITKNIKSGVHYGTETVSLWECTEGCPVAMLDAQSGNRPSSGTYMDTKKYSEYEGRGMFAGGKKGNEYANENGGASRFFKTFENDSRFLYCAKASKRERNEGCEGLPEKYNDFQRESSGLSQGKKPATGERSGTRLSPKANHHPTVKPIALCKYLINMITPPNGTCIDPFLGSGSTGVAAIRSGFKFIGIEREKEYMDISEARLKHAAKNRT